LFDGSNYAYSKTRMTLFLKASGYYVWKVVEDGPYVATIPEAEWDETVIKKMSLDSIATNILFCALSPQEFNHVQLCKNAKEIWEKLQVTYEGTTQVKATKISMLTHKYELFKMEESESISEMFTRFNGILNELKGLGKTYENAEVVRKILRSLPHSWSPKVTAIEEAKDLDTLKLDELMGSLMTHEMTRKNKEEPKKKKELALITTSSPSTSESDKTEGEDNEIALLSRQFKKFLSKKKHGGRFKKFFRRPLAKGESSKRDKEDNVICYKCRKLGHMQGDCPEASRRFKTDKKKEKYDEKERFKKKKAMVAAWSDEESSSSESEEE